ncbi:hypothetical protein [Geodermatophilus sp. SYSU D01105]
MSFADWVALGSLVAAVVSIAVAVYYGRRALKRPKREIRWSFHVDALFSQGNEEWRNLVEVRVSDRAIRNPCIATLSIRNVGSDDIPSSLFDGGRPIEFEVAGKVAYVLPPDSPSAVTVRDSRLAFGPELLKSGDRWTARMITDGTPQARLVSSYVIDSILEKEPEIVDGVDSARAERQASIRVALLAGASALIAGVIGSLGSILAANLR